MRSTTSPAPRLARPRRTRAAAAFLVALSLAAPARAAEVEVEAARGGRPPTVPCAERGTRLFADEELVLFPTRAYQEPSGDQLIVPVHAWLHEPEADSLKRGALLAALRRALGLSAQDARSAQFDRLARLLLVDQQGGRRVRVELQGAWYDLGETDANGHARAELVLPLASATPDQDGWLRIRTGALPGGEARRGDRPGGCQVVAEQGVSVISDIDDTIKVSEVRDQRRLACNLFLEPWRAVPGMAALYAGWARAGAQFHYLSASPWQLWGPLAEFAAVEGFPEGIFHLKQFGFPANFTALLQPAGRFKAPILADIIEQHPGRRFVLVGDSGEQDPEVYGEMARRYPERVALVLIRNAGNEAVGSARLEAAFQGVAHERWRLFADPASVGPLELLRAPDGEAPPPPR
jgi:phosphatidate phosphatase APP1